MPKVGDKDFPYTDEGIKQAAAESDISGIPVSNASERNTTTYAGGGKTGFNVPQPTIDDVGLMEYKKGGKTDKKLKKVLKKVKKREEHGYTSFGTAKEGDRKSKKYAKQDVRLLKREKIKEARATAREELKIAGSEESRKTIKEDLKSDIKSARKAKREHIKSIKAEFKGK